MQEIINYTNPQDFTFDTSAVEIDANGARLKKLIPNATFVQSFKVTANADYPSTANLGATENNGIFGIGASGYAEFNGANENVTYNLSGSTPLQKGTIQFKYMPLYSGSPTERQYLVNQSGNIVVQHAFNGNLEYKVFNGSGVAMHILYPWSPDANVLYDIEVNYDFIAGIAKLFIDGVEKGVDTGVIGQKTNISQFKMGGTQAQAFRCYGFAVKEGIDHEADFMPTAEILPTVYSTEIQRIEVNSPILTNGINSVVLDKTTTATAQIKYLVNVSGVDKYYSAAASQWIDSSGSYNSAAQLETFIADLDLTGGALVKIIPLLESISGDVTPEIDTVTVDYGFNLPNDYNVSTCVVFGFVFDHSGDPVEGAEVYIDGEDFFFTKTLSEGNTKPALISRSVKIVTDADGRWGIPIVETVTDGTDVTFTITYTNGNGKKIKDIYKNIVIPNQLVAALGDLV